MVVVAVRRRDRGVELGFGVDELGGVEQAAARVALVSPGVVVLALGARSCNSHGNFDPRGASEGRGGRL